MLTPGQIQALYEQWEAEQERQDARAALICCVLANCFYSKREPAFKVSDFMPQKEAENKGLSEMNPDELLARMRLLNASLGGKEEVHG